MSKLQPPATPLSLVESAVGGVMIGLSAAIFLYLSGQRTGISGIFSCFLPSSYKPWKTAFVGGFLGAALLLSIYQPALLQQTQGPQLDWTANALGGLLVGFGTRLGNGCTSGHGVCGLARLSKRGLCAVLTFMGVGAVVATLLSNQGAFRVPSDEHWDRAWGLVDGSASEALAQQAKAWWGVVASLAGLALVWDLGGKGREGWGLSLSAMACGALFATGLVVSQMVVRQKVVNFLWLSSSWDPSLMAVMGGAVLVNLVPTLYLLNTPGSVALCDKKTPIAVPGKSAWQVSKAEAVDLSLLTGAALFGAGWGLSGMCPGPAWVAVAAGFPRVVLAFLPCLLLGNVLHALLFAPNVGGGGKKRA